MNMVSCYTCVLMIFTLAPLILLCLIAVVCMVVSLITHVTVFDWLTLDFFCLTLQAMVFDFLYCLSLCVRFIINFIVYGIVGALVYQFTRFMSEITVYSNIGA